MSLSPRLLRLALAVCAAIALGGAAVAQQPVNPAPAAAKPPAQAQPPAFFRNYIERAGAEHWLTSLRVVDAEGLHASKLLSAGGGYQGNPLADVGRMLLEHLTRKDLLPAETS